MACGFLIQAWWILAGNPQPGWYSDSLFYLILADFYSGHSVGRVPALSTSFYEISRFPPLFPIALALAGAGIKNWVAAYYLVLAFGLLAIVTSFLWLRQQTGRTFVAAALLPIAILSPQYFYLHLEIVSESQFILLLTVVFSLVGLCERRRCSILTVAAVASLLPLSRTAGLTLLVALSIWLALKRHDVSIRRKLVAGAIMWLPAVAWILYRRLYPVSLDYVGELTQPLSAGLVPWLIDVGNRLPSLIDGYASWFDWTGSQIAYRIAVVILALAAVGWYRRLKALHADALFLPIYLGLIAVWPYPVELPRLLSVTMPVIALSAWYGLDALCTMIRIKRFGHLIQNSAAVILLFTALLASSDKWIDIADRAMAPLDPQLVFAKRTSTYFVTQPNESEQAAELVTRFVEMSRALPDVVTDSECVWTPFFAVTAFFSSFKVRLHETPTHIDSNDAARNKLSGCRYVLVTFLLSPHLPYKPLYPAEFIDWGKPRLLSRMRDEQGGYVAAALIDLLE